LATGRIPSTGQLINSPNPIGTNHQDEMKIKYTRRAEQSGWLTVKLSESGLLTSLCEYTKVMIVRSHSNRTYFKILDGHVSPGKEASLSNTNAEFFLKDAGPEGAASITVEYDGSPSEETSNFKGKLRQQWANLTFNGKIARVTLNSD
jgi:hypothetical protein